MITMQHETQCAGWFKIEATRPDGTRRVLADWFPNLILDGGLDRMGANHDYLSWCQVGSGSTAPVAAQTALVNRIAGTNTALNNSGAQASAPYFGWIRQTYRFAQGVAAGNLSEVGVGWATSGSLFSRALILDGGGSPTTITVLSDEVLDVTYELRRYPGTVDLTGTVVLNGVTHNWVSRASGVTNTSSWAGADTMALDLATSYDGDIGAVTALFPSGTAGSLTATALAYSAGSYVRAATVSAGLNDSNLSGGIRSLVIGSYSKGGGRYQIQFDPAIPKDDTKVLSLTIQHSWARRP